MDRSNRCTVLVNSCDAYEDLWEPFFKLFSIMWKDCPYDIVLNTESKTYEFPGLNIRTFSNYKQGKSIPWGRRFRYHLSQIDTKYVIIMLDDFFLEATPDIEYLEKLIDYMVLNADVASFTFGENDDPNNREFETFPDFYERPTRGEYKYNLQAGIWRTKELLTFVKPFETPWEWEIYGNIRSYDDGKKYYVLKDSGKTNIIQYGFVYRGVWGVYRGKWVLPGIEPLFKAHGIAVDFFRRGIYDDKNGIYSKNKIQEQKETIATKLRRRWRILCSLEFKPMYILYYFGKK